jgi:malonate transporter
MLPLEAIAGLNGFVLFFALPCMLYRFGATTPIAQLLDAGVFFTWLLCALVIVAFTVTISLNARIGWNDGAFGALVAAFPNTGFMGVPLLVALLGPRAAGPIIVTIMVDMVITTSLCIALSRARQRRRARRGPCGTERAQGHARQPAALVHPAGRAGLGFQLRAAGARCSRRWGCWRTRPRRWRCSRSARCWPRSQMRAALHDHPAVPLIDYLPVAAIKLLLHPLLVLLVGATAVALGAPLDRFALTVMVLIAALPSASNVSLLAERFGADNGRIARIILVSTAAAFLTFSGAVSLLI